MRKFFRFSVITLIVVAVTAVGLGMYNQYDIESLGNGPDYDPTMPILRTPDARFDALPDFPFEPHYIEITDPDLGPLRVHYLDEGPRDGKTIVLVHGQATWAYNFRKMIPPMVAAGYRVVVPDMVGFGRSDKPADWEDHTYQKQVDWLKATLLALNIKDSAGFLFDWGGYFGLRVAVDEPDIFDSLILVTTILPRGKGIFNAAWVAWWRRYILKPPVFPISGMVADMTDREVSAQARIGMDAPYPDESYKAGPRRFPMLIPATFLNPASTPNREAWAELANWNKPTLTLVSERLAKRGFNPKEFHEQIPGTAGQPHETYPDTGFFIIEDIPAELAQKTIEFVAAN